MGAIRFDRVGDVVLTLGSTRFGSEYYKLFRDAFDIDACTVFAFPREGCPTPLVVECDSLDRRRQAWQLACDYSNGSFKHDPIIRANLRRTAHEGAPIVYRLCADQVRDAGYRRHFYDEPALQQKIGVLGGVDGTVYYANFYHGSARSMDRGRAELRLLSELAALAVKMLRRHHVAAGVLSDQSHEDDRGDWHRSALSHLQSILRTGPHGLSSREAEVCAHVALGYSTLAIGLKLGVSVNTVATHRKRAYFKLGICSQNELFERYFRTVNELSDVRSAFRRT